MSPEEKTLYFAALFSGKYILDKEVEKNLEILKRPETVISEKQEALREIVAYIFDKRDLKLNVEYSSDVVGEYSMTVFFPA